MGCGPGWHARSGWIMTESILGLLRGPGVDGRVAIIAGGGRGQRAELGDGLGRRELPEGRGSRLRHQGGHHEGRRCCTCGSSRSRPSPRCTDTASAAARTSPCCTTSWWHRRTPTSRCLCRRAGLPGAETMVEPWVFMNFHRAYEYLYLSQTVDAREAHRLGMVTRVVPRAQLDETAELIAQQIAQAPLSVLMGVKAGVKRAWEGMGMRVHLQSHLQVMEAVGRAGDVAKWRQENIDKGYGASPRQVAARRAEIAAQSLREDNVNP